jgi:hypothetical protein
MEQEGGGEEALYHSPADMPMRCLCGAAAGITKEELQEHFNRIIQRPPIIVVVVVAPDTPPVSTAEKQERGECVATVAGDTAEGEQRREPGDQLSGLARCWCSHEQVAADEAP